MSENRDIVRKKEKRRPKSFTEEKEKRIQEARCQNDNQRRKNTINKSNDVAE